MLLFFCELLKALLVSIIIKLISPCLLWSWHGFIKVGNLFFSSELIAKHIDRIKKKKEMNKRKNLLKSKQELILEAKNQRAINISLFIGVIVSPIYFIAILLKFNIPNVSETMIMHAAIDTMLSLAAIVLIFILIDSMFYQLQVKRIKKLS